MTPATGRGAGRPAEGGFTLLEVLIALAILGTAVVIAIQGVSQGLRLLKAAGDQQKAIMVADQKARELLVPIEGTESGTDGRFSWQRTARVLETPELTLVNEAPKWRVFQISVVVIWDEQRRLEVSTLRTVPATSDPTRGAGPFSAQRGVTTTTTTPPSMGGAGSRSPSSSSQSAGSSRSTLSRPPGSSSTR